MNKLFHSFMGIMLLSGTLLAQEHGPFCGAVGTEGCNAVAASSSAIKGWATGCTVVRGPVDIANPEGERVRFGTEAAGVGYASSTTTEAVSLGDGGTATLTFAEPIRNVEGPDFAVFENSFNDSFLELAFVEVSTDGVRYVRFPATSLTPTTSQVGSIGTIDPTMINNLAGKFRIGYGTPFDLEELRDSVGIDIDSIVYVRVVDVVGCIDPRYATYDAYGHAVNDPYPTNDVVYASGGFDLTGVAVLKPTTSIAGQQPTALMLFPNPAQEILNVEGIAEGGRVVLCDLKGVQLMETVATNGRAIFSLESLPSGIYMVRANAMQSIVVKH